MNEIKVAIYGVVFVFIITYITWRIVKPKLERNLKKEKEEMTLNNEEIFE